MNSTSTFSSTATTTANITIISTTYHANTFFNTSTTIAISSIYYYGSINKRNNKNNKKIFSKTSDTVAAPIAITSISSTVSFGIIPIGQPDPKLQLILQLILV